MKSGADVNKANDRGDTPLKVAALHRNLVALRLLVEAGAIIDPALVRLAEDKGYTEVVNFLVTAMGGRSDGPEQGRDSGRTKMYEFESLNQQISASLFLVVVFSAECCFFTTHFASILFVVIRQDLVLSTFSTISSRDKLISHVVCLIGGSGNGPSHIPRAVPLTRSLLCIGGKGFLGLPNFRYRRQLPTTVFWLMLTSQSAW